MLVVGYRHGLRSLIPLVSEFDVVIVVSAGNAANPWAMGPRRLLRPIRVVDESNRIGDPAMAANVVTVGALAHGNGLRGEEFDGVQVQAVTLADGEPCPTTRSGTVVYDAEQPIPMYRYLVTFHPSA